jgi:hypothetical protein
VWIIEFEIKKKFWFNLCKKMKWRLGTFGIEKRKKEDLN